MPLFVTHFLKMYKALSFTKVRGSSDRGRELLCADRWLANIPELENLIDRTVILVEKNGSIGMDDIFPNTPVGTVGYRIIDS